MSEDDVPDMGFCDAVEAYFVVETHDGDPLYAELVGCSLRRRFDPLPGVPSTLPCGSKPIEPGLYVRFKCISGGGARGYFFDRYAGEKTKRSREHDWVVEYTGRDGKPRQSRFRGALRSYKDREKSRNRWWYFGTIKVVLPF